MSPKHPINPCIYDSDHIAIIFASITSTYFVEAPFILFIHKNHFTRVIPFLLSLLPHIAVKLVGLLLRQPLVQLYPNTIDHQEHHCPSLGATGSHQRLLCCCPASTAVSFCWQPTMLLSHSSHLAMPLATSRHYLPPPSHRQSPTITLLLACIAAVSFCWCQQCYLAMVATLQCHWPLAGTTFQLWQLPATSRLCKTATKPL